MYVVFHLILTHLLWVTFFKEKNNNTSSQQLSQLHVKSESQLIIQPYENNIFLIVYCHWDHNTNYWQG
jgi:ribosome recycling factor